MAEEKTRAEVQTQIAVDQNWRNSCKKEVELAKSFQENWGFLSASSEAVDAANQRDFEVRTVKYFAGKEWTVKQKRVPVREGIGARPEDMTARFEALAEKLEERSTVSSEDGAALAQFLRSKQAGNQMPQKRVGLTKPTSMDYGLVGNLEVFGVSNYGVKGTMSKLPPWGGGK